VQTIRGRVAVWYSLALGATIFIFGTILYVVQSSDLAQLDSRVRLESDLIAAILSEAFRARDTIVMASVQTGRLALVPAVASLLEGVPGFVIVLGLERDLFLSSEARALPFVSVDRLVEAAGDPAAQGQLGTVNLTSPIGEVRFFVRPIHEAGLQVVSVVSAAPTAGAALQPRRLVNAMLWTAPFIIAVSWFIGYFLVGRTLAPVDNIVDEVKAISGGRSLHRRLATPYGHDELARLTTTLNEMLAGLERSFTMLRRFTADASHELKTPLTVLRAGIERSITHPGVPPDVMAILEETLLEVNQMTEMVNSLLTLAWVDEGRAPLHLDEVDFREILSELEETANILGEHQSVQVEVTVPDHPIPIEVDRGRVRQLLMNLLTNAVKYTHPGGRVWVRCSLENGDLVLTVRDTGIGIAPGDLPHVFDRFWRADPARSRTGARPGAGLGLAISKWTAEAHGGSIVVQSRPGRGTTFTVRLPMPADNEGSGVTLSES